MATKSTDTLWLFLGMVVLALSLLISVGTVLELRDVPWAGMQFYPAQAPSGEASRPGQAMALYRPGGVTQVVGGAPAAVAGIQRGDRVLEIDGFPTYRLVQLRQHVEGLRLGFTVDFRVERDGNEIVIPVVLASPLASTGYLLSLIAGFVGALVFGGIAVVVLLKKPGDSRARLFYAMSVVFAAGYLLFMSVSTIQSAGLGVVDPEGWGIRYWVVLAVYAITGLLLGPLLLHFVLVFPKERPVLRNRRPVLGWMYSLAFSHLIAAPLVYAYLWFRNRLPGNWNPDPIVLVLIVATLIFIVRQFRAVAAARGWRAAIRDKPVAGMSFLILLVLGLLLAGVLLSAVLVSDTALRDIVNVTLVVSVGFGSFVLIALFYPVVTIVALRRSYREANAEERAQVRWPTWGTMVALVGVCVLALISLATTFIEGGAISWVWIDVVTKLLYLLIPVTFAFAILKYRLLDIELLLRKAAVYSIFTGLLLVLYLVLAGGLGGLLVGALGIKSQWVFLMAVVVVGVILIPVRNRIQSFVDRRFFRSRFDYPQTLNNLSATLRTVTDVREITSAVAGQVQEALHSRAVVVLVRRATRGTLKAASKIGLPDEALDLLEIPAGSASLTGGAEVIEAEKLPASFRRFVRASRAEWIVPVRRDGETLGAITLGRKLSGTSFDDDDREFVAAVADHLAVALENVHLREKGAEVDRALEIQRHLLPKSLPAIEGYDIAARWQPSRIVGGDYYDVIDLGAGLFGLCIADATGKGMPAALLMSNLQAAVRALAPGTRSPAELCRLINEILCGSAAASAFVSFFYGVLDASTGALIYSNAGHNHPMLLRADGSVERLGKGGLVLGAFAGREYGEGETRMEPGDRLLLFTDGITEAERADDEMFGEERLLDILREGARRPAAEVEPAIMDAVSAFSAGELRDDATLVVVAAM